MQKKKLKSLFFIVLSNLMYALSYTLFYLDNKIAGGGFSGVAMTLSHVLPVSPGLLSFLMTAPFLLWGLHQRGWSFCVGTLISSTLFSIFEDSLLWLPALTDNRLLAALFGGGLYSLGTVFTLKSGVSSGGSDLVIQLIRRHIPYISHGTLQIIFNVTCVSIAVVTFGDLDTAFYSILAIYVGATFTDHFTQGQEKVYVSYVITKNDPEPIARAVEQQLHRGVTLQQGLGMYEKENQNILMIVVKPQELYRLRDMVSAIDPRAFVVFTLGSGAFGGGFQEPKGRYPTKKLSGS